MTSARRASGQESLGAAIHPAFPPRYVVAVGLGANLGDRVEALRSAVRALLTRAVAGTRVRVSALYESAPLGPAQPHYLNAAIRLGVDLAPDALLDVLLEIEAGHGRVRREKWGPRTLDLDVLFATGLHNGRPLTFASPRLSVPHPGLSLRAFALAPLLDVMPAQRQRLEPLLAALGGPPHVVSRAPRTHERGLWPEVRA